MLSDFAQPKGESVILSPSEMHEATEHGKLRHRVSVKDGRKDKSRGGGEAIHIIGALGELATAKVLGIPWEKSINTFKAPDVGGFQVRTATQSHQGMIFRPGDDNPDDIFICVTRVHGPHFIVRGWQYGYICARDGPLTDFRHPERGLVHNYPQHKVRNLKDLPVPVMA